MSLLLDQGGPHLPVHVRLQSTQNFQPLQHRPSNLVENNFFGLLWDHRMALVGQADATIHKAMPVVPKDDGDCQSGSLIYFQVGRVSDVEITQPDESPEGNFDEDRTTKSPETNSCLGARMFWLMRSRRSLTAESIILSIGCLIVVRL